MLESSRVVLAAAIAVLASCHGADPVAGCADIDGSWSMTRAPDAPASTVSISTQETHLSITDGPRAYTGAIDRSTCVATLEWHGGSTFVPGPLPYSVFEWEELELTFTSTSFTGSGIHHVASTTLRPPAPNELSSFSVAGQKL